MIVVISPAKKLGLESRAAEGVAASKPELMADTTKLVEVLRGMSEKKLGTLMKLSDKLATLNHQRYQDFSLPLTKRNARQSVFTFMGDTYIGLDAATLQADDLEYAQSHLRILSGLYGVLRPLDLMQAYRLEMGTRLKTTQAANLYEFWGEKITDNLNATLTAQGSKFLLNCASNEYFKAIQPEGLDGSIITPVFKQVKNGEARMIGMMAKRARGALARFVLINQIDKPDDLKDFKADGYRFQKRLSSETHFEFHKSS